MEVRHDSSSNLTTATVNRYRIQRLTEDTKGGNKANVNVDQGGRWAHSPDAMIQDGQWHRLGLSVNGPPSEGRVQFIFDVSSLPDKECYASYGVATG